MGAEAYTGEIMMFGADFAPRADNAGWLFCDGRSLSRTDPKYRLLFQVIGTAFGSVDSSHFNLPDLRERAAVGSGHGTGLTRRHLGENGGQADNTHTVESMAWHRHAINEPNPEGIAVQASTQAAESAAPLEGGYLAAGTYKRGLSAAATQLYKDNPSPDSLVALDGLLPGDAVAALSPSGKASPTPAENRQPFLAVGFYIASAGIFPPPQP